MAPIKSLLQLLPILLVKYYCVQLTLASGSEYIINKVNQSEIYLKSECVKKLITNQKCGTHITIVVPNAQFKDFVQINSSCHSHLVVTYGSVNLFSKTNIYLVYYKIVHANPTAWQIRYNENWNPYAKYIFVTTPEVQYPELREIFRKLSKYYIYDVTVLTQMNKTHGSWSFYPLKDGNCVPRYDKLQYLGTCTSNKMYPVGKDLSNCTISVTGNKIGNTKTYINSILILEEYLLNVCAKTIGVKLKYSYEDYDTNDGEVFTNNTSVGMLNFLQKRKTDIVFGGFFLTAKRAAAYDFIPGYKYTRIKLIIPNKVKQRWIIFYNAFKTEIWSLIAFSFISMTVISVAMSHYCFNIKSLSKLPFQLIDYFFGHSDGHLFKVKKFRIILTSWIFFTYFISNFYNSAIYFLVTKNGYEPQSLTFEELQKSGYTVCISDSFRAFSKLVYNVTILGEQIPECRSTENVTKMISSRDNYYTIADYSQYENNLCDYHEKRFTKLDVLNNIIYVLYTSKGFFLTEKIKKIVNRMFESGIITDSHMNALMNNNCVHPKKTSYRTKQIYTMLSLDHLKLSFYILLSGYFISFVVFLIEFFYNKN